MEPTFANPGHAKRSAFAITMVAAAVALTLVACGGGTTTDASSGSNLTPASTNLRPLPAAFLERKAVAYSPFRTAPNVAGRDTEVITDVQVKQDLDLLVTAGVGLIRLFDSSDKVALRTLRVISDNNLDIKVMLGIYVNTYEYETDPIKRASVIAGNEDEITRGVALAKAYPNQVVAVSVGNETMVTWSTNPISTGTMARYIKTVRDQITQPVTTDDNYAFFAGNVRNASEQVSEVFRQIDFASVHTYPSEDLYYSNFDDADPLPDWDWQQTAVTDETQRAQAMMAAAIGKAQKDYTLVRNFLDQSGRANLPIVIGETGWKATDPTNDKRYRYTGHPVNQKMYLERLLDWAVASKTNNGPKGIVYFEAFDEPWKGQDDKWGLFTVGREARCSAQALNPTATWAKEAGSCAESQALYFKPPVPGAAVTTDKFVIFDQSVPAGWPVGMRADMYGGGTPFDVSYTESGDSAPGDEGASPSLSKYIEIRNFTVPASYGWGLLWQSTTPNGTANLSNFANGSLRFSVKTSYAGKLRVGVSSDTVLGAGAEAFVLVSNGTYGYCNTNNWCDVSIPLSAFKAANPKLDLSLVLQRFSVSDIESVTSNPVRTGMPAIRLDNIHWLK